MLKATVLSVKGEKKSEITLPEEIFACKVNPVLMAQAVKVHLNNLRLGNNHTKTRAEINRTKAKWFKQKGTGRARHGARSAPIFVGGGIAHGPRSRDWHSELPFNMRQKALASALSQKLSSNELLILENVTEIKPKTKQAVEILNNLKLSDTKVGWTIGAKNENLIKAARNLPKVILRNASQLTTYDVLNNKKLILDEDSIATLIKRFNLEKAAPIKSTTSKPKITTKPKAPSKSK